MVGSTICGSLGRFSLGLTGVRPAGYWVHNSWMFSPSASRMDEARAVTTAEPPPMAITASASNSRSARMPCNTAGSGLWAFTPAKVPAWRSPSAAITGFSSRLAPMLAPQKITARLAFSRSSSPGNCARQSAPLWMRTAGVAWVNEGMREGMRAASVMSAPVCRV